MTDEKILTALVRLKRRAEESETELRAAVGAAVIDGSVRQTDVMRRLGLAQETVRRWTRNERERREKQ